jgi:hypothetical protein
MFINFKIIEMFFYLNSDQYYLGYKQIISIVIIAILNILVFIYKNETIGFIFMLLYLLLCTFDILRFSVITVVTETGLKINNHGLSFSYQPISLFILVCYVLLNLNTIKDTIYKIK